MTFAAALIAIAGAAMLAYGLSHRRNLASETAAYLLSLDGAPPATGDAYDEKLSEPMWTRIVRPFTQKILSSVGRFTPSSYLDRVHHRILLAGLNGTVRAEDVAAAQLVGALTGALLGGGWMTLGNASFSGKTVLVVLLLPFCGALAPRAWLTSKVDDRQEAILKDLPDTLDLLAISVEAGLGLEGAMAIVCQHFETPLGIEFSRTLKEMELGVSRRDALHNLKRRTEVPDLSNFVLALTQADALGMPVGRVLHTQAEELRKKRRQRAREKAGKLPVKIMFPLVFFIFPAVLVVILGPAMATIMTGLR